MANIEAPIIGISRHRLQTDGIGVTTLVAFHGCPLRCKFCLNPHSWRDETCSTIFTVNKLYETVKIDELYFLATNGGITFGGGEPCLYDRFIREFRKLCGSKWNLSLETSLNVPLAVLKRLFHVIDHYIIDIKDYDSSIYRNYTGQSNFKALCNLEWLADQGINGRITVRVPYIEGYNSEETMQKTVEYVKSLSINNIDIFRYITEIHK